MQRHCSRRRLLQPYANRLRQDSRLRYSYFTASVPKPLSTEPAAAHPNRRMLKVFSKLFHRDGEEAHPFCSAIVAAGVPPALQGRQIHRLQPGLPSQHNFHRFGDAIDFTEVRPLENIKITTPEDMLLASAILQRREEQP